MRKYWYPVIPSKDLVAAAAEPTGMYLLDEPIVLYRDPSTNEAVVLADKCPHRSAALSTGRIMDGRLECRYHGWQVDATGSVVRVPSLLPGRKIPANAKVKRFPTHEADGLVWIWPGNPADAEKVPKPSVFFPAGPMAMTPKFGYIDLDIDHCLLVENFLDPAHLPFTHEKTIGKRSNATAMGMSLEFTENGCKGTQSTPERPDMIRSHFEFRPPIGVHLHFEMKSGLADQCFFPVPTRKGHCRFLWFQRFPFLAKFDSFFLTRWLVDWYFPSYNKKIVMEDYAMLVAQQERLALGANAMNSPVNADLLIKTYRNWWRKAMKVDGGPFFKGYSNDIEDIHLDSCSGGCGTGGKKSSKPAGPVVGSDDDDDDDLEKVELD
ncbi:Rieske [2Fe-2S] iron-sulfur domain-containing protein [Zopfochytrium polystomum]|nr:Rieske [2Fe-2S] iron-sulfur domain-containing protein [Zopfochytrium polystomum]